MYNPVKAIEVFLWGQRVGALVHDYDQYFVFEYDRSFQRSGLEVAPFLMRPNGQWELAPAYDLTGYHSSVEDKSFEAWSNPHVLSVNGKSSGITDADLLAVAARYGIGTAKRVLSEVKTAVG